MGDIQRMTMADGAGIDVYRAEPAGFPRGSVVVVQEIFGLTDHIREVADSYAAEGYLVLAPALFDREQPGFQAGYEGPDFDRAIELARKIHPFDQSVADVATCVEMLEGVQPVFVVGYCYGGSVAWAAAARVDGIAAASAYYGSMIPDSTDVPRVPTIAHFGRHDAGIPVEKVEALAKHPPANAAIHLYDAGHGFNSDRRKDYDPESAALARARTLELFDANSRSAGWMDVSEIDRSS
ncbi:MULTISPECIES: dienelactone hydrolase family protein [unclassified Sphingomonas]|uniref:dienelactone hydrolase family protein n=1 Tax=unclassified Sphingomonas TaxID=196159 RepID=UPI000A42BCD5|nr:MULTISPECIES: dienelactone hydrolase family protein [unclassified Sphingomonas]